MGMVDPVMVPRYLENLDWLDLIEKWAGAFGGRNITVLNYDLLAQDGKILPAFLQAIDSKLVADFNFRNFTPVASINESLPADLLEFKRIANGLGEFGLHQFLYRLMEAGYKGPTFRIPEHKAKEIISLYLASNERVARDILGSDQPLFPDYGGSGERDGVDLFGKLPVEALAAIVAFALKEFEQTKRHHASEIAELKAAIAQLQQKQDG